MIDENIELILEDAREHMALTLEHLASELNTIRAGRATPAMLDSVRVEYYGSMSPLNQMASVSAPQPDLITVQPWDRSALSAIEKAIIGGNLGLNPANDGMLIRIPIPPLSEDRRRDLAKGAKSRAEDAKVSIRNIRRSANTDVKKIVKDESLPEDMRYEAEDLIQKATDKHIGKIEAMLAKKEAEIMEV